MDSFGGGAWKERRNFVRLHRRLSATYRVIGQAEERIPSLTQNLSSGGMSFFTESELARGTMVEVEVQFPGHSRPVRFTAEVIWSGKLLLDAKEQVQSPRTFETGVRFRDITPEDRDFLMKHSSSAPPASPS